MNTSKKNIALDDVLDAYVATEESPTHLALKKWIKKYPEYEKELIDFTVSWSLMNEMPCASNTEQVDEESLILRGMSIVQNKLHTMRNQLNKRKVNSLLCQSSKILIKGEDHGRKEKEVRNCPDLQRRGICRRTREA